ncbi:MAG TPA: diguanylate cyclase [Lacipirellulaceae bacterium]|nr:diguanylate cyclase [Lacipirellulaceae bacterium]
MSDFPYPNGEFFQLGNWTYDGIAIWDLSQRRIIYANPAFWELMAAVRERAEGRANERVPIELTKLLSSANTKQRALSTHLDFGGERGAIDVRLVRLGNEKDSQIGMIVRKSMDAPHRSTCSSMRRDPLTGFRDREFLMRRLTELLHDKPPRERNFALLFLDLDNFKRVNDEFGHLIGDNVLREAACRIAECVREGDHVIRFGGDEFVVVLEGISDECEVEPIIGRIEAAIAKPISLPVGEVTLTLSVGMALASEEHCEPEDLLTAADRAMYAAKRLSQGLTHSG